ncbi:DUF3800 domain-containing protein [Streptomyces sp. NPDC012421]|uniref:DUF3800 domain-containing protein n=1 Tax=Streptomyces sp. NPDC012421 TaxID=3364832 RepID=UPI0036E60CAE
MSGRIPLGRHAAISAHPSVDRRIYIDDSGSRESHIALYSAVSVPVVGEVAFENAHRELRVRREHRHGVPRDYEIHSYKFLTGRGRPGGRILSPRERSGMGREILSLIGDSGGVVVTSVYSLGRDVRAAKQAAFAGLLRDMDERLQREGERAELIVDGDGTDRMYEQLHAEVHPQGIPHPVTQLPAGRSLLLQAADLVAYSAFQALARQESRRFMWDWYEQLLPKATPPREA